MKLIVKGQTLRVIQDIIASDTIDYLTAVCEFTDEWDGFTKFAHFENDENAYTVMLENDKITKNMHLNLTEGRWNVYLHGDKFSDGELTERITSTMAGLIIRRSGLDGEPIPITPSVGEQILAVAQRAETAANNAVTKSVEVEAGMDDLKSSIEHETWVFIDRDGNEESKEVVLWKE